MILLLEHRPDVRQQLIDVPKEFRFGYAMETQGGDVIPNACSSYSLRITFQVIVYANPIKYNKISNNAPKKNHSNDSLTFKCSLHGKLKVRNTSAYVSFW
jgi:hypothetical protein